MSIAATQNITSLEEPGIGRIIFFMCTDLPNDHTIRLRVRIRHAAQPKTSLA